MGGMKGYLMVRHGEPNRPRGIKEVGTGAQTTHLMRASERFAERVAPVAQTTHPSRASERFAERVAPVAQTTHLMRASERFAERVAPVAQTTHPSQAGLALVLNSRVVPPFLRRGSCCGRVAWIGSFGGGAFNLRNNS